METINSIPFFPLLAVLAFVGLLFLVGHITKKKSCDHKMKEFFRLVPDENGVLCLQTACYCRSEVEQPLRGVDGEVWSYAMRAYRNQTKPSGIMSFMASLAALPVLMVGAIFIPLRLRAVANKFYYVADIIEDLPEPDNEKWQYIDRRDEKLAKYLDTCNAEVILCSD